MRPFDREVNDGGDAHTERGYDSDEDGDFIPKLLTAGIDSDDDTEDGEGNFSPQLATVEVRLERLPMRSRRSFLLITYDLE